MSKDKKQKICFHDTTLRDGEQTPGVSYSRTVRKAIAHKLDELGVDIIELGFAASGDTQRDAMREIVESGINAKTLSLSRPLKKDIDAVLETNVDGIILVLGFSDIHLKYKLNKEFEEALAMMEDSVSYAKEHGLYVQISMEDGTRTQNNRIEKVAKLGEKYNIERICISDTVGIATPAIIKDKVGCLKKCCTIPISVHCHNDFGLATINSIAAVQSGARNLAVTMNGLGERTGNASLEQCVMALTILYGYKTNIKLHKIIEVSRFISQMAGITPEPMRPIIGANCFKHESGIHVDGVLKNSNCYEPYAPQIVGGNTEIVLGKTNGMAAIKYFAQKEHISINDIECKRILKSVQKMCDNGIEVNPEMLKGEFNTCKRI